MAGRRGLVSELERQAAEQAQPAKPSQPKCATVGCAQGAMNGFAHCRMCEERREHERAEAACLAKGLTTLEAKKAYCKRVARELFKRPSFERWAETITQAGVDTLVRMATRSDEHALKRLQAMGVIDARNVLIPHEKRAEARAAIEARVRAERERIEATLKAQGVVRREPEVQS